MSSLRIPSAQLKQTIHSHPEFVAFMAGMEALFADWRQRSAVTLKALQQGCHPKTIIRDLAENLLAHYADKPLMDPYGVYQHLMDYWATTMQDDCYLIAANGWKAETYRIVEENKQKKLIDKGWTCDLIPKSLIVARYFAPEQQTIQTLEAELESASAQLTELEVEHGGEEGLFSELEKINKATVTARLKELKGLFQDEDTKTESDALEAWLKLSGQEAELKRKAKDASSALDMLALAKYPLLTASEIKMLVIDDKWLAAIGMEVHGEMERISQAITQRVKELAERYETSLPEIFCKVESLQQQVNAHLAKMGFAWKP